jgi:FlaA1/EpsC-like NDP-sugar epimerase
MLQIENKTILVTGSAGFIGSNLCELMEFRLLFMILGLVHPK